MKNWTIDNFVAECEDLRENQYTYDYSKMPEGVCNGHKVKPYMGSWSSVVIDGRIVNLWKCISVYDCDGEKLTPSEYVRRLLER